MQNKKYRTLKSALQTRRQTDSFYKISYDKSYCTYQQDFAALNLSNHVRPIYQGMSKYVRALGKGPPIGTSADPRPDLHHRFYYRC
jgi:hypothetical protein